MAKVDIKRFAARFAGRPVIPNWTVVAGAAANTNIAVSGINVEDGLVAVLAFDFGGTAIVDRVSEATVTSAGNIQLSTTNTTGKVLLVNWVKVRP